MCQDLIPEIFGEVETLTELSNYAQTFKSEMT